MADENNPNFEKSTVPVDIETMKVKLIIVCKDQNKLDPVATFLNRRGWEVQITTKIKDALAAASTSKPDFVLVSANHPNPKLMKFPTILKSTFKVPCIGFAESTDTRAQGALQNLPVQWRIAGPLSGPTTQRRIKQILQEIYGGENKTERKARANGTEEEDDIIMAKGGAQKKDAIIMAKGSSAENFAKEFGDDEFPENVMAGETVMMPDSETKKDVSLNADGTIFEEDFTLSPAEIASIINGIQKDIPSSKDHNSQQESDEIQAAAATTSIAAATAGEFIVKDEASTENANKPLAPAPHEAAAQVTDRIVRKVFSKNPGKPTFFEKLVIKILNELRITRQTVEHRVGLVERLVIISVQSPNTNGYLVLSSTATNTNFKEICAQVKNQLSDFLRQEGKMFEFGTPAMVICSAHDFTDQSQTNLEFTHVADCGDGELAIKFLSAPQPLPKLLKVEDSPHYRIEAKDVPLNRPVDFKFFLHLEKNQKFVTLIKEGGALSPKYQERLNENGKGLFIEEEYAERFKRFFTTALALDLLKVECFRVEYAEPQGGPEKPAAA